MKAIKNKRAKAFIEEVIEVSKKHGLSLGHEDIGGGFIVTNYKNENIEWLKDYILRVS
ncbi:hypothetical protein [Snuella sedimenti]|uniref:Uncharacterized protein n=1 Tax=Snuella sedimenti TaxID=2798802 RepID=A0A8J7LLV2_9FLAO|nr:hypothetical protein [Snuella sedimenti]MBJ6366759.1 hypothetical protein [Snuella sedimenti]